ncbi:hypothetical protein [Microbacterium hominis]|uniref:Uncharacterized protein n=1 Tax=Microbacterium hominis TaxID=162426 RepID=A0A7D4Q0H0_9MICO|nr:hypothetical protein [Microbacterium hominis]QKJ19192.1 hypothetical protein HQM25_07290 [Microbacterium hominis]
MSARAVWITAAAVAVAVVVAVIVWLAVSGPGPASAPTPTVSPTPTAGTTESPSPSPESTPTATPTPTAAAIPCDDLATDEFLALAAGNGWTWWQTQDEQIGARPFDRFPGGAPADQVICRWGASPDIPTDNVIDLAWAPMDPDAAAGAQDALIAAGYGLSEDAQGIWLVASINDGGDAYLFTDADVRWSFSQDFVRYITPSGQG